MSSSAASQLTGSHLPSPRAPARLSGCSTRSGSSSWFGVTTPLAHVRPRLPGCTGLPSIFRTSSVS